MMIAVIDMDNAGFIFGSYAVTFAVLGVVAWRTLRAGRRLSRQVDDEHKHWT